MRFDHSTTPSQQVIRCYSGTETPLLELPLQTQSKSKGSEETWRAGRPEYGTQGVRVILCPLQGLFVAGVSVGLVGLDDLQLPVVGRDSKALCFSLSLPHFFFWPFCCSLNACSRLLPSSNQVVWGRCHRRSGMRGMRRLGERAREREGVSGEGCADTKLKSVQRSLCCGRLFPPQSKKNKQIVHSLNNDFICQNMSFVYEMQHYFSQCSSYWFYLGILCHKYFFVCVCVCKKWAFTFSSCSTLQTLVAADQWAANVAS